MKWSHILASTRRASTRKIRWTGAASDVPGIEHRGRSQHCPRIDVLSVSRMTVRIPMSWKRQGGRKVIIAPDGSEAWLPTKPRPDETLIHALARGASVEAIAGGGIDRRQE